MRIQNCEHSQVFFLTKLCELRNIAKSIEWWILLTKIFFRALLHEMIEAVRLTMIFDLLFPRDSAHLDKV